MKKFFLFVLLALMLNTDVSFGQSILKFNGLSLSSVGISGPVHGTFFAPLNQFSFSPLTLDQEKITLGQNIAISFSYALIFGTAVPDATIKNNISLDPDFILDAFAGDGFLSSTDNNGVYVNRGILGCGFAIPHLLGNVSPQISFPMAGGPVMIGVGLIGPLDFLNGFGVIQVH